ncbi:Acyl-CoA reductase [Abditibacterium utsteinense]|uniref:Acyl-CoA reductase n=1 Tax=Abditibacterium utsteinense TaxID=1960156 RepID=A0A2S8SR49_9BACT|nr:aldehyde dehydrogenase family protein [Abditibacterium utsteinense]PQV63292.1 Acyl-CoA reductase [Abditibacterium utsteinense]
MASSTSLELSSLVVPLGEVWNRNNLIWNDFSPAGNLSEHVSPFDGRVIQKSHVLSPPDLSALFGFPASSAHWTESDIYAFTHRLQLELQDLAPALREATQLETAFSATDCEEIVEGTLSYLKGFFDYYSQVSPLASVTLNYEAENNGAPPVQRKIVLKSCPWGTVVVMMPQNAVLLIGVICLLNALITGNRVVLRAPLQGARTAALLACAVARAEPPQNSVSIVVAKGREFLDAAHASPLPLLIHYLGASQFGGDILKNAFTGQKPALIDGTGNTWVWVGDKSDPFQVAELLLQGATRYNGQTCTSINGAIIHPSIYEEVSQGLQKRWSQLQVGKLFDEQQAKMCLERVLHSSGQTLCGGHASGNELEPTLVANPHPESELVREGIFGPVLWIQPGTKDDFISRWPSNHYPLCVGVLDGTVDEQWWLARLPNLARLVINGDPSVEHIYEPWGGYPASGSNEVGFWHQKYQRTVSLDTL